MFDVIEEEEEEEEEVEGEGIETTGLPRNTLRGIDRLFEPTTFMDFSSSNLLSGAFVYPPV